MPADKRIQEALGFDPTQKINLDTLPALAQSHEYHDADRRDACCEIMERVLQRRWVRADCTDVIVSREALCAALLEAYETGRRNGCEECK